MRRAPGPIGSAKSDRRGGPGLSSAGRSIVGAAKDAGNSQPSSISAGAQAGSASSVVGAPKAASAPKTAGACIARPDSRGTAKPPVRPGSRGTTLGTRRLVAEGAEGRLSSMDNIVSTGARVPTGATVTAVSTGRAMNQELDDELRDAVLSIFRWCDADADGILNAAEYAAAQRLIAELCPGDFDEAAASSIFETASDGGTGGLVDEDGFLRAMQTLVDALKLPRRHLMDGLKRQTSRHSSKFDRSVSDFKQALVRNVSNLPEEKAPDVAPPAPLTLWRTDTGGHSFEFPPGAADGPPVVQMAFKMMQFLGMKTEDSSFIESGLAAKMMGHRQMFRDILNMCGDVKGVHIIAPGPSVSTVDLFLAKSMSAEQMFRVRISGIQLQTSPTSKLIGMGGFEPAPVDPSDIPPSLFQEMLMADGNSSQGPDLSALGKAPPPPLGLIRQKSIMCDEDLQTSDLVLTACPVGRHLFRICFKLAENAAGPAPNYILLVPRIKTAASGHARYADHDVRVHVAGVGAQPETQSFSSFVVANIRGHTLARLVLEHEFTSCQVRVQDRSAARKCDIVPAIALSLEERAFNLAHDDVEAGKLRQLLESQGLGRRSGERDLAYAVRLGRALCKGYEYDVDITEAHVKNLTSLIWEKRRGDCSAFNTGFVYALRVFGVPARVSLGFKYGKAVKQACGAVAAPHAEAEFYAEGIGWVPCDATLGLKRLGHDGGTTLTFVEWRPSNVSLEEAEEMAKVLRPLKHPDYQMLCKKLEEIAGGDTCTVKELAHVVSKLDCLAKDRAEQRVAQLLQLCGLQGQPAVPVKQFARGWAAVELGKFFELGAGGGLTSTSKAGAKFYEGGPFKDSPLELSALRENMMVPDDVEKVLKTVGGKPVSHDWSSMWPYGVFLCSYEFEEKPLP